MRNLIAKTFFLTSVVFLSFNLNAQVKKGKYLLSASIYYYRNSSDKTNTVETNFSDELNYSLTFQRAMSDKLLFGFGIGQINRKREDIYSPDSYYKSKANFWDFNLIAEYQQKIDKSFFYSPMLLFNYSPGKQTFKTKLPGFQETGSESKGNMWGISVEPLDFSYFIKDKYRLSVSLGKIIYGGGKSKNNIPGNNTDEKGNSFYINFSPYLSNVKISIIL